MSYSIPQILLFVQVSSTSLMHAFSILLLLALCFVCCSSHGRPIIGILTLPTSPEQIAFGSSFIPLDYVQWIESGAARVVPIPFQSNTSELLHLWKSVNGILLPRGSAEVDPSSSYFHAAEFLYNLSVQAHSPSSPAPPIWGSLDLIGKLASQSDAILSSFDAKNL